MSFAIFDGARPYVPRKWDTRVEAASELLDLLKGYPRDHEWRQRLRVVDLDELRAAKVEGRRGVARIEHDGRNLTVREWATAIGLTYEGLRSRLARLPVDQALTAPASPGRPRKVAA